MAGQNQLPAVPYQYLFSPFPLPETAGNENILITLVLRALITRSHSKTDRETLITKERRSKRDMAGQREEHI